MDTAGSECLENQNSTDCLLRALLNILAEQKQAQDAGIDWDPITFGFTLLIGLVASMIALATVFQAVLAGGKGGRRANGRAIGRWSKYTTRKWVFSEMSWSYTAYTPVLRLSSLQRQLRDATKDKKPERKLKSFEPRLHFILPSPSEAQSSKRRISGAAPYPATWLGLFRTTGLESLDDFDLTPTTADYLPDDFIAVPASAEVGAIIAITAAAGVQRLDFDMDQYPVILGLDFQFDFRQHPVLGTIGAFSEYRRLEENSCVLTPSPGELAEAVMHSRGIVEPWREVVEPRGRKNPFPNLETRETGHGWFMHTIHDVLDVSPPVYEGRGCFIPDYNAIDQTQMYITTFILAKSPKFTPSLFPLPVAGGHSPFTAIALAGQFWSKVKLLDLEEPNWEQEPELHIILGASSVDYFSWLEVPPHAPDDGINNPIRIDLRSLPSSFDDYTSWVIFLCLSILVDPRELPTKMAKLPFEKRKRLRRAVHKLLERTDKWLTSIGDNDRLLVHRIQRLLYTSIFLSKAERMAQDGLFEVSNTEEPDSKQTGQQHHHQQQLQQQQPPNVRGIHFKMLEALRGLIEGFDLSQKSLEAALNIVPDEMHAHLRHFEPLRDHLRREILTDPGTYTTQRVTPEDKKFQDDFGGKLRESESQMITLLGLECDLRSHYFNTHQILSRLATVVGCHPDSENRDRQNGNLDKIDDVLILRTLLIGVLFFTALDNSKLLESGVWDRVVPII